MEVSTVKGGIQSVCKKCNTNFNRDDTRFKLLCKKCLKDYDKSKRVSYLVKGPMRSMCQDCDNTFTRVDCSANLLENISLVNPDVYQVSRDPI